MHRVLGRYLWQGELAALVAVALVCAAPAVAVESAEISTGLKQNGSGQMIANSQTNPFDETWSWEACTLDLSTCRPFAQGRVVGTAGAPPRTVFRVTSSYGATAVSPVWRGRLAIARPPSVRGPVRANQLVTPAAGKWKGGWSDSEDWFQLSACEGPRGRGCTTLTDMHYTYGCPNFAAVLEPEFVGWYLRVADMRVGRNTGILDYGVGSPYGHPVWKRSSQIAVAIVGKIAPASGPRTETCGTPPYEGLSG